jgi:hypothetical protein
MKRQPFSCERNQQQPQLLLKQTKLVQKDAGLIKRIKEAKAIFAS